MQEKINEQFISEYAKTFSSQVASAFFKEKDFITGKEILTVTPSKQVNFFVLKTLYGQWQEEMKKLESPYFNYREPAVKKALVNYMNVLSQYIEVEAQEMESLLEVAVSETLNWLVAPLKILRQDIDQKKIASTDQESLKRIIRYFKIYAGEIKNALDKTVGGEIDDFLSAFEGSLDANDQEKAITHELQILSEVDPIRLADILIPGKVEELVVEEPDEKLPEPKDTLADNDEAEVEPDESDQEEQEMEESSFEQPGVPDVGTEEELVGEKEESEESDYVDGSLNEQFKKKEETLNDQFKQEEVSVATKHQQQKVASILEAISVNTQYMFTSKLFGGNSDVFIESVGKIEKSRSFDDAVEMLVREYAPAYSWDMNSNEVKELLKIVFRKFR